MAHLGSEAAAYVDGQLPAPEMIAARHHLRECQSCRLAVMQQETLKIRMKHVNAPEPPHELLASLARLKDKGIEPESRWARLCRSAPARMTVALVSASAVVVAAAYMFGVSKEPAGDPVLPSVDDYALAFAGSEQSQTQAIMHTMSNTSLAELEAAGWPCPASLGTRFDRVDAALVDNDQVVDLTFSDGRQLLKLFEQSGALDVSGLDGFVPETIGRTEVWVRDGIPLIATWDADGVVFTVVTDASRDELAPVIAELPARESGEGPLDRVGNGLDRMTSWLSAA